MSVSSHPAADSRAPLAGLPPAVPTEPIWRLSVAQYHEMIRGGILSDDDPVELLNGWLVTKMMIRPPHAVATELVREGLTAVLPEAFAVRSQQPIALAASEPEPDAAVVPGPARRYVEAHPGPRDVLLVVEVAEETLARDRTLKKAIYAQAGIPVYWIVNLADRCVEVFTDPTGPAERPDYRQGRQLKQGESAPVLVEGSQIGRIAVDDMLP